MHDLTCEDQYKRQSPITGKWLNSNGECVNVVDILQNLSPIGPFPTSSTATIYSASNGTTLREVPVGGMPILSIRPQTAYAGSGRQLIPINFGIFTGANCYFEILKNATLTGASWADISGTSMRKDVSATSVSGGVLIASGYLTANGTTERNLARDGIAGLDMLEWDGITSLGEILTVKVTPFVASTPLSTMIIPAGANIEWREIV